MNVEFSLTRIELGWLQASGHRIDADEWHEAVHASLPYCQLLRQYNAIVTLVQSLPDQLFTLWFKGVFLSYCEI